MRTLAFVDIDGVVAPTGLRKMGHPLASAQKPLLKSAPRLLRILATQFQPVWCSSGWTHDEIVNLNDKLQTNFPICPVPHAGIFGAWEGKPAAIVAYADGRPFALLDDHPLELPGAGPHVVIKVNGRVGLTGRDVSLAKRWALARMVEA